ncbi:hypothetical protein B0H10DRAFT_1762615, partial [Mycena sp. CBHHK59/15]
YLYYGLKRFNMHTIVKTIPLLLHASLLIFFAGLIAFLVPMNKVIMILSVLLFSALTVVDVVLNILPIFYSDCPYHTP